MQYYFTHPGSINYLLKIALKFVLAHVTNDNKVTFLVEILV